MFNTSRSTVPTTAPATARWSTKRTVALVGAALLSPLVAVSAQAQTATLDKSISITAQG